MRWFSHSSNVLKNKSEWTLHNESHIQHYWMQIFKCPTMLSIRGRCSSLIINNAILTNMIFPQIHLSSHHLRIKWINHFDQIILHCLFWHNWICIKPLKINLAIVEFEVSWHRGKILHWEFKCWHHGRSF